MTSRLLRVASAATLLFSLPAIAVSQGTIVPGSFTAPKGSGIAPSSQARLAPHPNFEVNLATGNVLFKFQVSRYTYKGPAPHNDMMLCFNTQKAGKLGDFTGGFGFGQGWSTQVGARLQFLGSRARFTASDGGEYFFDSSGGAGWVPDGPHYLQLEPDGQDWLVTGRDQFVLRFDASGHLTELLSPSGNALEVQRYLQWTTQSTEPSGRPMTFGYTAGGKLDTATDYYGTQWSFGYDANGRLKTITDPNYGSVDISYNSQGRINGFTDLAGHTWGFQYVNSGLWKTRVDEITMPDGSLLDFNYEYGTFINTKVTDRRGNVWQFKHDQNPHPRLRSRIDPLGNAWLYTFNAKNQVLTAQNPSGHTWIREYDAAGYPMRVTDPLGRQKEVDHDALGNRTHFELPAGEQDFLYEDASHPNRMTTHRDAAEVAQPRPTTTYSYHSSGSGFGRMESMVDAEGVENRFEVDGLGLPNAVEEWAPDRSGPDRLSVPEGLNVEYVDHGGMAYPSHFPTLPVPPSAVQGRLNVSAVGPVDLTWWGELASMEIESQVPLPASEFSTTRVDYTYDAWMRPLTYRSEAEETVFHVDQPPAQVPAREFSFTYDDAAGTVSLDTPDGDTITWTHDAAGRVSNVTSNQGSSGDFVVDYAYSNGELQTITRNDGTSTHLENHANGYVDVIEHKVGQSSLLRLEYDYDPSNRPIQITETTPGGTTLKTYTYDARGQLETETHSSSGTTLLWTWIYDQVGNRIGMERRVNGVLAESVVYHYDSEDPATYGSDNNRLVWMESTDGQGAPNWTAWLYYKNPFGNVSHFVRRFAGSQNYTATVLEYTDRGLPWLAWKETWTDTGSGPQSVSRTDVFEIRGASSPVRLRRPLNETTFEPESGGRYESWFAGFVSSFEVDESDGTYLPTGLRAHFIGTLFDGDVTYELRDAKGTVRLDSVNLADQDYNAFGVPLNSPGILPEQGFGGAYGASQGLGSSPYSDLGPILMGARFYLPEIGRFLQRDPMGLGDGPNVYAFVHNRPLELVDPTGLSGQETQGESPQEPNCCKPSHQPPPPSSGGDQGGVLILPGGIVADPPDPNAERPVLDLPKPPVGGQYRGPGDTVPPGGGGPWYHPPRVEPPKPKPFRLVHFPGLNDPDEPMGVCCPPGPHVHPLPGTE